MNHLPEITQTIVKSLLSRKNPQAQTEDCISNETEGKIEANKQDVSTQQTKNDGNCTQQEREQQNQQQLDEKDTLHTKQYFIRSQKQKLKLLYPNFIDKQIETVAIKIWDELDREDKQKQSLNIRKVIQNKSVQTPVCEKIVTEQITNNNGNAYEVSQAQLQQMKISAQTEMSVIKQSSQSMQQTQQQKISQQQQQQIDSSQNNEEVSSQVSNQASTNLPLTNEKSQCEATVQKYILLECRQTMESDKLKQYSAIIISEKNAENDIDNVKYHKQVVLKKIQSEKVVIGSQEMTQMKNKQQAGVQSTNQLSNTQSNLENRNE